MQVDVILGLQWGDEGNSRKQKIKKLKTNNIV